MFLARAVSALFFCSILSTTVTAWSDEIAPALEESDLRRAAQSELKRLFAQLSPPDQKRLAGVYVAALPDGSDLVAQVACDDDGDYVIVVSDAMLRLSSFIASALAEDAPNGAKRRIDDYAALVARSQLAGRALLPPPRGFFGSEKSGSNEREGHLSDVLSFLMASELVRLRTGDLACPHPTPARESGDAMWTADEQRHASVIAGAVYPARQMDRDVEATHLLRASGRRATGGQALLGFFGRLELEAPVAPNRYSPSYVKTHAQNIVRASLVEKTAEEQAASSTP